MIDSCVTLALSIADDDAQLLVRVYSVYMFLLVRSILTNNYV